MIDIRDLKFGSVVRLASGSPKMMIDDIDEETETVTLFGWGDHTGFVEAKGVSAAFLVWPKPASDEPRRQRRSERPDEDE